MKRANRLIGEKSPYLLQHAHNPVDWHPWGEEAFERARRENKPVFLSIGYSTCHWCHVMERESFADEETARLLNSTFVCVKVDREERPDIDRHYMDVCQALTGSGGWPLTIIMTPDKKPFFAGTYFPKSRQWGRAGLMEIVPRIREFWTARREALLRSAEEIAEAVTAGAVQGCGSGDVGREALDEAYRRLEADFDEIHGGFGAAPKFPSPQNLFFLLRFWKKTGRPRALAMVEKTLQGMRQGGIYDQLGFGFHRYSTDARWLVPHFEKMLYDQALLAKIFIDAFLATRKEDYRRTAFEILDYVLRDMTSPEGGFYSAEDADSEGEEGRFYLWTAEEIRNVLGAEDARRMIEMFNIRPQGNFVEQGRSGPGGRNILHSAAPVARIETASARSRGKAARAAATDDLEARKSLDSLRARLFAAREKRVHPFKDTKILTDWNGLAVGALAAAGRISDDERHIRSAENSARFILSRMRNAEGHLFHVHSDGEARIAGFLDDYTFLIDGLIELYKTTFDPLWLEESLALTDTTVSLFWDKNRAGFFFAPPGSELPHGKKEGVDGALPSGNSVMLMNVLRLARMTGRPDLEETASNLSAAFAEEIAAHPQAHTGFLCAVDFAMGPSHEVVIVGRTKDATTQAFLRALRKSYLPNAVILFKSLDESTTRLEKIAPFLKDMTRIEGRSAAYVCAGGRCLSPALDAETLIRTLSGA